jgi:hypothetical protein
VNAGLDASYTFSAYSSNFVLYLFTLSGNSAGNINSPSNLLWEVVSKPIGANFTISTPNNNSTVVNGSRLQLPTGEYVFRLGVECITGGRVYDSVKITVLNVADFYLRGDKPWTECADKEDSIHLVGRPLKIGEELILTGSNIALTYSNANTSINSIFNGPTTDSVRFTIKTINFNQCILTPYPFFYFRLSNGAAITSNYVPIGVNAANGTWLPPKLSLMKTGSRATDTLDCVNYTLKNLNANNICSKGGVTAQYQSVPNVTVIKLTGSGIVSPTVTQQNLIFNTIQNMWDTVTPNTLHTFEVRYGATNCYPAFKDTIKVFFKSLTPTLGNLMLSDNSNNCFAIDTFPLLNYKFPIFTNGIAPAKFIFNSLASKR